MDDEQKPDELNLPVQPAPEEQVARPPEESEPVAVLAEKPAFYVAAWRWYLARKKWTIPASILLAILVLAAIPWSRYHAAALVIKKDLTVEIKDSKTNTPVSGAAVSYAGQTLITNAEGKAVLPKLKAGHHPAVISKKYYKDQPIDIFSPILAPKNPSRVSLIATGRQVPVHVTDYVDDKPLAGATITIADTNAKTDSKGDATVVVPAGLNEQKAVAKLEGYNDGQFTVNADAQQPAATKIKLVPAGKIYFFSKRTGKLDLMKANLDGSSTETVLAGTGYEQVASSFISQSPDWKYIALVIKRSSADATPQLYILSTGDDRLLNVDGGNANFVVQGWSGSHLIYTAAQADLPDYQTGKAKLKSYDAATGKTTQLDQTKGSNNEDGTAAESYAATIVSGGNVIYAKNWAIAGTAKGQEHSLNVIGVDGQDYKLAASYPSSDTVYYSQHTANSIYVWQQPHAGTDSFYDYTIGSAPKQVNINSNDFYSGTQGYYPSPSGKYILWTEQRDGKNTLLIGDQSGGTQNVASFSDYLPFGWYTDKYLILTKTGSELYILGTHGGSPLKITDYQYTNYYF
ncbi:MAG: hypothetical protein JWO96_436 [Candidatus Saccharibacteria bacterium]|nr:hypothetical protein [Candidatus Saccharibacteria bacterium]